jgi:transcription initiation factor TFIIA large subunit
MKLLYTNGDEEIVLDKGKGSDSLSLPTQTPVNEEEDDEINSDLDDDDDDDDKDVDGEGYDESGTMDENVVLCQYEKVSRTRNKWRCVFKSGIIHVNGADYVFSKANGEFEW